MSTKLSDQKDESQEIKTLKTKMVVLSNAVIEERKKSSSLEKRIIELQSIIDTKENEIILLNKEKMELQSQLSNENKKQEDSGLKKFTNLFNLNSQEEKDDKDIEIFKENIKQLKFENEILKKRINDTVEENEKNKLDVKNKNTQIKKLELENLSLQNENYAIKKKIENSQNSNQNILERQHFEKVLQNLQTEKNDVTTQLRGCLKKIEQMVLEAENIREENSKLTMKLAEYKNLVLEANLKIQIYHVKKLGGFSNKEIDIIFGRYGGATYVMMIVEDKKEEIINIEDIEYVKKIDIGKVEVSYMYKAKKYLMTILVNELVVDQFVQAYFDFYSKSVRVRNKLLY